MNNQDSVLGDYILQLQRQKEERERQKEAEEAQRIAEEFRLAAEREAAERERQRMERINKEIEEARIRAERRAKWWKKNGKIVWSTIAILVTITLAIIIKNEVQNVVKKEKAEAALFSGDSCLNVYAFEEAKMFYEQAMEIRNDTETKNRVVKKLTDLSHAKKKADDDYNAALRKLKIFLDADDNEFNQYSDECLDKMIKIYPNRQETIYYKNIRGK